MIDTIIIKLHHVSKYPATKTKFEAHTKRTTTTHETAETEVGVRNNAKVRSIMFHDSDTIIPLTKRTSFNIPSSNYLLSYFYKIQEDTLEFNFSVPKFMYGTNVLQYVPYFEQSSKEVFRFLSRFIDEFCLKVFPDKIDLEDLELCRIDLCYNQFFPSKVDALRYLSAQEEIMNKYARSSKNRGKNYKNESIVYVTDRYSFKIYHKGTEFAKNDKKQLAKKNPKGYNINDLQHQADRILRYEITFRRSMISYLFKERNLHNDYLPFDASSRDSMEWYLVINPEKYQYCIDYVDRGKTFLFDVHSHEPVYNLTAIFNEKLFCVLYQFFWDYVKKFQLEPKLSIHDIKSKIQHYNETVQLKNTLRRKKEPGINQNMLVMIALAMENTPLHELKKLNLVPESTFYRYQRHLKKIGIITENKLPVQIPKPSLDYLEYKYLFGRYHPY